MADELEAVGAFTTAGLVARSLKRKTGEVEHEQDHPGTCANCEHALTGPYCSNCGQRAHVHRSLLHMAEEMVHGIAHFDGKVWRTLPRLAFKPGLLTRDYIEGRRARYVSPMALFLFVVFLMFMIFSFMPSTNNTLVTPGLDLGTPTGRTIATQFEARAAKARADLEADRAAGRDTIVSKQLADTWESVGKGKSVSEDVITSMRSMSPQEVEAMNVNTGWSVLDEKIKHYAGNPELLFYKLKNTAYKFSFLLIPISLPFIWLMFFWRRDVGMYDHAVFALYSLSFMSLLFTLCAILWSAHWAGWAIIGSLIAFAPPIHMYAQLKGTYGLSRFGALVRTTLLLIFSTIALTLFTLAIVALGVSG